MNVYPPNCTVEVCSILSSALILATIRLLGPPGAVTTKLELVRLRFMCAHLAKVDPGVGQRNSLRLMEYPSVSL